MSSKKANFFYLFFSTAVFTVSQIIHKGKITRMKRARIKVIETSLFCCSLIMYHGMKCLSRKKENFCGQKMSVSKSFFYVLYNVGVLGVVR